MVYFAVAGRALSLYPMLHHTSGVATLKFLPRNCLRFLQTTMIMGEGLSVRIYVRYCRIPLATTYKSFVKPNINYWDILDNQTYNNSFHKRLESTQYNAALAITFAIRSCSRETLYQELGFESLHLFFQNNKKSFFQVPLWININC